MKKSKFIKSSLLLMLGGLITKALGMFTKLILTRKIDTNSIGLYSMILPVYLLLISISGMGLTTALNVLIPTKKYNNKNLIITSLFITLLLDIVIFIALLLFSKNISNLIFHTSSLYLPILSIGFVLPFISVSNIFRSYYYAKERLIPHIISNILEDLIKLILIIFLLNKFIYSNELLLTFLITINIFSELSSILIFIHKFPNFNISKKELKIYTENILALFKIAIPTTISRLIGSFAYFLEPIILTTTLVKTGYSSTYIQTEYGVLNGYVLPILLLPSFFIIAISQALIPSISSYYSKNNLKEVKNKLKLSLIISLIIGLFFTIIFNIFSKEILYFLYKTNKGLNYIKFMAPLFIFHYIEHPLLATLQAINKSKENMKISIYNFCIRTFLLILLCHFKIGLFSLVITLLVNIIFTSLYSFYKINYYLNKKSKH